jgi:hypothetical protein
MNYRRDKVSYLDKNDVFFDDISSVIISELKKAQKSVKLAVAWITVPVYYHTFVKLLKKEVRLQIILSDNSSNRNHHELIEKLSRKGAKIYYIKMPNMYNHMHHKFCIIDNKTVLCGSYNWTKNAEKNFENLFVLRNNNLVIQKLKSEFKGLKQMSEDVIKKLQKLETCEYCRGKLFNLLVLIPEGDIYHSMRTYLIRVCSENPDDHFKVINDDLLTDNTNLELLNLFENFDDELENEIMFIESGYESELQDNFNRMLDFKISEFFKVRNKTFNVSKEIHSIGMIRCDPFGTEGDVNSYVHVYWRDKFVASLIENRYETFNLI